MPLGGHLKAVNSKAIAQTHKLDSFIINHFKVLPTEDRYQNLTEEAKLLLFEMVTDTSTAEDIRKSRDYQQYIENQKLDNDTKKVAEDMGIDVDAINKMIESGGLNG